MLHNSLAISIVLLDRYSQKFVAVGEHRITYFHAGEGAAASSSSTNMVQVMPVTVLKPETALQVPVCSHDGTVICSTLGEAYDRGAGVWWMERDTVVTA